VAIVDSFTTRPVDGFCKQPHWEDWQSRCHRSARRTAGCQPATISLMTSPACEWSPR